MDSMTTAWETTNVEIFIEFLDNKYKCIGYKFNVSFVYFCYHTQLKKNKHLDLIMICSLDVR